VARASISNNLMRYSVKDYFLKAGICHLATGDMVSMRRALDKYVEMDPGFASQRECILLRDLAATIEAGKPDDFTDKLFAYDQVSKLDRWKTALLLKVKNSIEVTPEDEGEDEFA
jgi:alpha-soluble NSF attachment protein